MDDRYQELNRWLIKMLEGRDFSLASASSDASFRRYFRVISGKKSLIAMDAPPDKEDCHPFVHAAECLARTGMHVPKVQAANFDQGFLLLDDLGSTDYLDKLNADTADTMYGDALEALALMQLRGKGEEFPAYSAEILTREMELYREWFLGHHLGLELSEAEHDLLSRLFSILVHTALEQPRCWVHRDYHSRNLMVVPKNNPGVIDFQDAVIGPVTYDLVSLLKDCYIAWPPERVRDWALRHRLRLLDEGFQGIEDEAQFLRWFDFMGVQRHLKVMGIFSRLYHRDGKSRYLADIPRVQSYVLAATAVHPELASLEDFIARRVLPAMAAAKA